MALYRRSPRSVDLAIDSLRERLEPQTLIADVQRCWPPAVGAALAAHSTPVAERGGTVTVACSSAIWAQEIDLMSQAVLETLNRALRDGRVNRLRCVVR